VTTCFGLVIEAETCCHLVTLYKINFHNTSCVLTCESLLLICIVRKPLGKKFGAPQCPSERCGKDINIPGPYRESNSDYVVVKQVA